MPKRFELKLITRIGDSRVVDLIDKIEVDTIPELRQQFDELIKLVLHEIIERRLVEEHERNYDLPI